jgi:trk system potassium uptake protein TrkA
MDLPTLLNQKILVAAIEREGDIIIPDGKAILLPDDKIYVIASSKDITKLSRKLNFVKGAKKVMIIGGSDIAKYLAKHLTKIDATVKIVERNRLRCIALDEELPQAEIIYGDGTDHKLVLDEGMAECDVVISLCSLDEQNIIISLFALSLGVKKVITKIDQPSYYGMLAESGLDSIVSLRKSTAEHIIKYVRSKQNVTGSKVNRLYNIVNSQAEAIEFIVSPTFEKPSVPLKDLKVIPDILIGAIVRNKELIIPGGLDTIEIGDTVIIVSKVREEPLDDLNDILA